MAFLYGAHMHALRNVLGTGSYPSQLDQAYLRDDYGIHGDKYDPYRWVNKPSIRFFSPYIKIYYSNGIPLFPL